MGELFRVLGPGERFLFFKHGRNGLISKTSTNSPICFLGSLRAPRSASAALILQQVPDGVPVMLACANRAPTSRWDALEAVIDRFILRRWHYDWQAYSPFLKA